MNLRETGVREGRAALMRAPDGGAVRPLGVGRKIKNVAVAAGCQYHRVCDVGFYFPGDEIAGDDTTRAPVDHHKIQHFGARQHLDASGIHLSFESLICPQQELLSRLPARVKRAGNLRPAKRPVRQQTAVFTGERHALRDALIDDIDADLRQPINVVLAGAEIAALNGVVEEAVDAVAIVLVVLGSVDAALRCDGVRAPRAVLKAEALNVVAEFAQRCGGGSAGKPGTYYDHVEFALVCRIHQLHFEASLFPGLFDWPRGGSGVEFHPVPIAASVRWRSVRPAAPRAESTHNPRNTPPRGSARRL